MDDALLSRFPNLTWLPFRVTGAVSSRLIVDMHGECHTISLTAKGRHDIRWITRGRERQWSEVVGAVHFVPADDEHHTFLTTMSQDFVSHVFLLPRRHLEACLISEGCEPPGDTRRLLTHDDVTLQAGLARLVAAEASEDAEVGWSSEEAARRVVLRILELTGSGRPDWCDDDSVFEPRVLRYVVGVIDEHLRIAPSLSDMALLVGLSPSHFAKKFRQSVGLSYQRFVNRRRIRASLKALKDCSQPLAHVALELGFSSQSHFNRLFSSLTGMTPAKYRKQSRRTCG